MLVLCGVTGEITDAKVMLEMVEKNVSMVYEFPCGH